MCLVLALLLTSIPILSTTPAPTPAPLDPALGPCQVQLGRIWHRRALLVPRSVHQGPASGAPSRPPARHPSPARRPRPRATRDAQRSLNDSVDYVYSSWDDSALCMCLEDKGLVDKKAATGLSCEQLLAQMRTGYARMAKPVWDAWFDSYIREWLLTHNIIAPTYNDYLKSDQQYAPVAEIERNCHRNGSLAVLWRDVKKVRC
ncbi:hypothetical protein FIBSPDRAFT_988712 [Athelia psychrophila]|uniref:Uncharacterized protein n=1 Tax=Athelia psychrophila TaxID=1759441 RepID=A0A166SGG7_9AGAM|nr:hypothetical protein FIBSPDRAFT_988712 [Fibularhizoctonia sp. CBS 109695]